MTEEKTLTPSQLMLFQRSELLNVGAEGLEMLQKISDLLHKAHGGVEREDLQ